MQALKYQVVVSQESTVVINVPAPAGQQAEVIVLFSGGETERRSSMRALVERWSRLPGGRATEEIDADIAAERASWEE